MYISVFPDAGHIKNTVLLIFRHIQCLDLMNSEVPWVLVSSGTRVQPQIILGPGYLPDYLYLFFSYDYGFSNLYSVYAARILDLSLAVMLGPLK